MRTTVDLSEEALQLAKAVARDRRESLGRVMSDLIVKGASSFGGTIGEIRIIDGLPAVSSGRIVTTEEVRAFLEESE
ncbi:MAG: hypothetical protein JNM66_10150 [Bryobacterales bacterium]|nr:hypothetical protein [Bryobacterales bacterium]